MWTLLNELFTFSRNLVSWFIQSFITISYKYPLLLAYIAAVSSLSVAFYIAILSLLKALDLVFPSQYLTLVAPFIPSNLHACFSIVLSVRFIVLSYNWTFKFKSKLHDAASQSAGMK
jgi:hypothetical protein